MCHVRCCITSLCFLFSLLRRASANEVSRSLRMRGRGVTLHAGPIPDRTCAASFFVRCDPFPPSPPSVLILRSTRADSPSFSSHRDSLVSGAAHGRRTSRALIYLFLREKVKETKNKKKGSVSLSAFHATAHPIRREKKKTTIWTLKATPSSRRSPARASRA